MRHRALGSRPPRAAILAGLLALLLLVPELLPDASAQPRPRPRRASCAREEVPQEIIGSPKTGVAIAKILTGIVVYEKSLLSGNPRLVNHRYGGALIAEPNGERFGLFEGGDFYLYRFDGYQRLADHAAKPLRDVSFVESRWIPGSDEVVHYGTHEKKSFLQGLLDQEGRKTPVIARLDVVTGKASTVPLKLGGKPGAAAFDARGTRLALGFEDGHVEVLSTADGRPLASYRPHTQAVGALAFHPSRDLLASAGGDARFVLYDLAGQRVERRAAGVEVPRFMQIVEGGTLLVIASMDAIALVDLEGRRLETVVAPSGQSFYTFFVLDPLGTVLTTGGEAICAAAFDKWGKRPSIPLGPEQQREVAVLDLARKQQHREALALADQAVKEFPQSANVRGLHAWVYLEHVKDPQAALRYAQAQKADFPRHPGGYYWAARAYETLEDWPRCAAELEQFSRIQRIKDHGYRMARCYFQAGLPDRALAALPEPQALTEDDPDIEGWRVWLKGQVAKRPVFLQGQPALRAQATAADPGRRLVLLVKCGLLGVPECAGLVDEAAKAGGVVARAAARVRSRLVLEPRFSTDRPAPKPGADRPAVPTATALGEIWALLDGLASEPAVPPIGGRFLDATLARTAPGPAPTMEIRVSEGGDRVSFGGDWITPAGTLDTSFEPGSYFGAIYVKRGAVYLLSVNFKADSVVSLQEYRPSGRDLTVTVRGWTDLGDVFAVDRRSTAYRRVD